MRLRAAFLIQSFLTTQHRATTTTSSSITKISSSSILPTLLLNPKQQCSPTNQNTNLIRRNMSSNTKEGGEDEVSKAKVAAAEYKLSSEDKAGPATIFDKLLSGEWPSDKVYEDDIAFAFKDVSPQAPTHILVIPKVRDGLTQLSKAKTEKHKEVLGHLMCVAKEIGKKECPRGFRIVINDGEHGAQSVYHLHLHVLGGRQMQWPPG